MSDIERDIKTVLNAPVTIYPGTEGAEVPYAVVLAAKRLAKVLHELGPHLLKAEFELTHIVCGNRPSEWSELLLIRDGIRKAYIRRKP